jgi:hypothetical protein
LKAHHLVQSGKRVKSGTLKLVVATSRNMFILMNNLT